VIVGRATTAAGPLYVKRYNVFSWRLALASLWQPSPAFVAWAGMQALVARGFETPEPVAAVEVRRAGVLIRSFFVTREVPGATTADVRLRTILAAPMGRERRVARRALARALGDFVHRLHAAGVYHSELEGMNVLALGPVEAPRCMLLDLERVRVLPRLGARLRVKNLVQLARTLGRQASAADRARFLAAYLAGGAGRADRHFLVRTVLRRAARKDRRKGREVATRTPTISCAIVCQNEEANIRACLETVDWCDEILVVDGGSKDRTVRVAQEFTDRVVHHPWPGHRKQKQFALEATRGEWTLNIDADERVTPELAAEIEVALARVPADVDGFAIPRLVCYLGRWWYRGGWYPRRVVRLVRRSRARWGGADPHERAEVEGRVLPLQWPILHYTYTDVSDHLRSLNHLTDVAAEQPSVPGSMVVRLVVEPAWRFLRAYVLRRGCLDGLPGFFVAVTDAMYVFVRWAKVWERSTARGGTSLLG
jgi:hypothetical protein